MFIPKSRVRFAPGIMFNQPAGDGGGAAPQGQAPAGGAPAGGAPQGQAPAGGAPAGAAPQGQEPGYKAPWEKSGEEFDADRAKKLLEAKDADEQKLKERLAVLEAEREAAENAKLTDQQRLEKERDEAKNASQETALEAARLRAAIKFNLAEEDLEFIHGKTPEEVLASAERYSERHKSGQSAGIRSQRPVALRGGTDPAGNEPDETDPRKLAESIPQIH